MESLSSNKCNANPVMYGMYDFNIDFQSWSIFSVEEILDFEWVSVD